MKVLEINAYNWHCGGTETVFFNTINLLEKNGIQTVSFTLKWSRNYPSKWNKYFPESKESRKGLFRNFWNLINFYYHFEAAKKMEQLIKNERPDIAQIHLFWCQITPSIFPVLKKYKIPIVFTVHDYRTVCPSATFRNGEGKICELCKGKRYSNCITKRCIKGSYLLSSITAGEFYFRNIFFDPAKYIDGLVYVSNFTKNKFEEHAPKLKMKRSIVLYNFSSQSLNISRQLYAQKYFLFYGRLSHEKGIKTLIKSFVKLPQAKLKIVGTGDLEKDMLQQASKSANVEFLGYKKGEELMQIVANAYFVVVPSECYENNPMTIIEAYSYGTPVIGSKIGGIPEIIEDGKTGFLFSPNNDSDLFAAVESSLNLKDSEYELMRKQAFEFGNELFNKDHYFERLTFFFKELLSQNK